MREVASTVLKDEAAAAVEAAGDVSPVEKLQVLLTKARRGNGPEGQALKKHGHKKSFLAIYIEVDCVGDLS